MTQTGANINGPEITLGYRQSARVQRRADSGYSLIPWMVSLRTLRRRVRANPDPRPPFDLPPNPLPGMALPLPVICAAVEGGGGGSLGWFVCGDVVRLRRFAAVGLRRRSAALLCGAALRCCAAGDAPPVGRGIDASTWSRAYFGFRIRLTQHAQT